MNYRRVLVLADAAGDPQPAFAVMGAFLVTYPGDKIRVLWFFGVFVKAAEVPALLLVGLWLVSQMMNQVGAVVDADAGGVAYAAHGRRGVRHAHRAVVRAARRRRSEQIGGGRVDDAACALSD